MGNESATERLKAEERALAPDRAVRLLAETCGDREWRFRRVTRVETVKRRTGRRLVLRYEVEAARAGERLRTIALFAKLYRGRRGARVFQALRFVRSVAPPALRFTEPLGYSERWRMLVLEALEAPALTELLHDPASLQHLVRSAAALAALHRLPSSGSPGSESSAVSWRHHDVDAELQVLDQAATRLEDADLDPHLLAAFGELHATVRAHLRRHTRTDPPCLIHRDLHPDQILLLGGQVALLDLDELCLGEPELDVGNLTAHLLLADLQKFGRLEAGPEMARTLLESYETHGRLHGERVAIYQAASLLRLASLERLSHAGRSVLDWPGLSSRLLAEATRSLQAVTPR